MNKHVGTTLTTFCNDSEGLTRHPDIGTCARLARTIIGHIHCVVQMVAQARVINGRAFAEPLAPLQLKKD